MKYLKIIFILSGLIPLLYLWSGAYFTSIAVVLYPLAYCAISGVIIYKNQITELQFNLIDISTLLLIAVITINSIIHQNISYQYPQILTFLSMFVVSVLIKNDIQHKEIKIQNQLWFGCGFVILVCCYIVLALLYRLNFNKFQIATLFFKSIRAPFHGPSFYVNYLTLYFPLIFSLVFFRKTKTLHILGNLSLLCVIVYTCIVIYNQVRVGIIALVATFALTLFFTKGKKYWYFILPVASLLLLLATKAPSTAGRWLIFKISGNMFAAHWFWGAGYNNFKTKYLDYQIHYFKQNGLSAFGHQWANAVWHVYNDFFECLIELGVLGVVVFIGATIYAKQRLPWQSVNFESVTFNPFQKSWKTWIVVVAVLCSFSHIFQEVSSFQTLFIVSLIYQVFNKNTLPVTSFNVTPFLTSVRVFIVSAFTYFLIYNVALLYWKKESNNKQNQVYESVFLQKLFCSHSDFNSYASMYFLKKEKYAEALKFSDESSKYHKNLRTIVEKTKIYSALGNYDMVAKFYTDAVYAAPSKFTSKYYLMLTYNLMGDSVNTKKWAKIIVESPIKVPSAKVNQMRKEAYRFL